MGCCSSMSVCGQVYTEMLRRLRVEATQEMDVNACTRRTQEFERIASGAVSNNVGISSSGAGANGNGKGRYLCVNVEQLRAYDRDNWHHTRIHAYNAVLMVEAVEDIVHLVNEMYSENRVELRRCDYRMWLLYMCEFYHVMEVFEKAKLLKGGSWENIIITQKQLEKCLTLLRTQFARAFTSEKGPGSAFHIPVAATPAAVLEQVVQWSQLHPLKADATRTKIVGGEGDGSYAKDTSTLSIPLVTVVRWVVLRYIRTFSNEEEDATMMIMNGSIPMEVNPLTKEGSWDNKFLRKQQELRDTLGDITLLEKLFLAMTHGTRELSESDAKNGCYNLLGMEELFQTRSVHDELVEVAFRLTLREMHMNNASCITELSIFAKFIEAYADALNLYYHVMMCNNENCDMERMYGEPAPDLEREMLSHVLQVLKEKNNDNNNNNNDYYYGDDFILKLFSSFATEKEDGVRRVPFLNFADAWITRLFRKQGKHTVKDISELAHALGLDDKERRKSLLAVLSCDECGHANVAARSFEALSTEVNLSQYCNAEELAFTCAREEWALELERQATTITNDSIEEIPSNTIEESWASTDILLLRLLHGIYGTFAAVQALEHVALENDGTSAMIFDCRRWETTTPVPLPIRLHVLHKADEMLGVTCVMENMYTPEKDVKEKISLSSTAGSLLQYIGNRYVDSQMMKWRRDAWRRLQELWPLRDEDPERRELFNILTNGGIHEVRVSAEEEAEKELEGIHTGGIHYIPFEKLYQQYVSELCCMMSIRDFQAICCKAVRVVEKNTPLCLSEEDEIPAFLRYLMGYMRVLWSLATPYYDISHMETTISWAELQHWLLHEAGIVMDEALTYYFMEEAELITPHNLPAATSEDPIDNPNEKKDERHVRVRILAEWFALREACWTSLETRLHFWLTTLRDQLPIHYTPEHTSIRHTLAETLSAADDYIPTTALTRTLRRDYSLWRVWPPELGPAFVMFAVWETNKILQRSDLQGSELHRTDIRFLLRFIYTYLDVLLRGEHLLQQASQLPTETTTTTTTKDEDEDDNDDNNTKQKGVLSSSPSSLSWKDTRMHAALHTLLEEKGVDTTDILNTMDHDNNTTDWTTSHLALVVARASVATALAEYMKTQYGERLDSIWYRLRERLPFGESQEQRLKRKQLFARMDMYKQHYLTLADLHRGIREVLELQEFREEMDPILFHAFFATKEVSFGQQDVIYLTKMNEHFITGAEFRAFLWYMYTYFQLYYMFDTICAVPENLHLEKAISIEAFVASKPLLKSWGVRVNNAAVEFTSISRRCKEDKELHFTGFAMWASQHHLNPEGYSHEEPLLLLSEDEKAVRAVEEEKENEKGKEKVELQQQEEEQLQEQEL
ncbi:flagellar calcium-binding protein [Trypanosoma theileri]|uniref:Flagellar calcium-binding protein n=1 Tax=Trypanosoma theileri TaxID=67003 RepID=A0A1X0NZ09_9TRYP|nr:flagellar calcium-binding protein [Trypanosoma theileri]ORC89922.1 flagellar calcium-binding protein [Trypanosoma theileri]